MQDEIIKLEKLVLLLTQKLESKEQLFRTSESEAAADKTKRDNSKVGSTPPHQQSTKRQKPIAGSPMDQDAESQMSRIEPASLPIQERLPITQPNIMDNPNSTSSLSPSERGPKFFGNKSITQYFGRSKAVVTD